MGEIDLRIEKLSADTIAENDPAYTTRIDDMGRPQPTQGLMGIGCPPSLLRMLLIRRHSELCSEGTRQRRHHRPPLQRADRRKR